MADASNVRDAPVGFHGLRHTWASHAVMNGVPLLVVAKNLGHSDTRMIEKHYGHLAPSYIADAIRAGAPKFGFQRRHRKDHRGEAMTKKAESHEAQRASSKCELRGMRITV